LVVPSMDDYIVKAMALADNLGLEPEPLLAPVAQWPLWGMKP